MENVKTVPDILGFTLEHGSDLLQKNGILINNISVTAPPRHQYDKYDGSSRIVKLQVLDDGTVDLTVVRPL